MTTAGACQSHNFWEQRESSCCSCKVWINWSYTQNNLNSPGLGSNYPPRFKIEMWRSLHSQKWREHLNTLLVSRIFRDLPLKARSRTVVSLQSVTASRCPILTDPKRLRILGWRAHGNPMFSAGMGSDTEQNWKLWTLSQIFLNYPTFVFLIHVTRQFTEL